MMVDRFRFTSSSSPTLVAKSLVFGLFPYRPNNNFFEDILLLLKLILFNLNKTIISNKTLFLNISTWLHTEEWNSKPVIKIDIFILVNLHVGGWFQ